LGLGRVRVTELDLIRGSTGAAHYRDVSSTRRAKHLVEFNTSSVSSSFEKPRAGSFIIPILSALIPGVGASLVWRDLGTAFWTLGDGAL